MDKEQQLISLKNEILKKIPPKDRMIVEEALNKLEYDKTVYYDQAMRLIPDEQMALYLGILDKYSIHPLDYLINVYMERLPLNHENRSKQAAKKFLRKELFKYYGSSAIISHILNDYENEELLQNKKRIRKPTRNQYIVMALIVRLSLEETNRILKFARIMPLSSRDGRDTIIIRKFDKITTLADPVQETQAALDEQGEELLYDEE